MDSLSYALGVLFATNLNNEGLKQVDGDALKTGFEATLAGQSTMSADESNAIVQSPNGPNQGANGLGDQAEARIFLRSARKTASRPPSPIAVPPRGGGHWRRPRRQRRSDRAHRGTLLTPKVDSSYKRGEPISFPQQRIRGWTEGLQLMQKEQDHLLHPTRIGLRGPARTGAIPPYAALVFEVELIEVNAKPGLIQAQEDLNPGPHVRVFSCLFEWRETFPRACP